MTAKDAINKRIETAREEKRINANLTAGVSIYAAGDIYNSLAKLEDELRFVLITSEASLEALDTQAPQGETTDIETLRVSVAPAKGEKCIRCWHVRDDVGTNSEHPQLCTRCVSNITNVGEVRHYA